MPRLPLDLRYAVRALIRRPAHTAVTVVTLALGIGACTLVFSSVYGLLARPLPFDEEDRLVVVLGTYFGLGWYDGHASYAHFLDVRERSTLLDGLAAYRRESVDYLEGERPERISAIRATADLSRLLGVEPALGRVYGEAEDRLGADRVVLLGHDFWRTRLGGDAGRIGSTIRIHGELHTILGVMPPVLERSWESFDVWLPLRSTIASTNRWDNDLRLLGRLGPGATLAQADAELGAIQTQLGEEYPESRAAARIRLATVRRNRLSDEKVLALRSLPVAVALVLLISCCNAANLLLARATSRRREMALRAALGAGRGRLVGQLLTESVGIALAAGALGSLLAMLGVDTALAANLGAEAGATIRIDGMALLFAFVVSLGTVAIFGLAPALRATRVDLVEALKNDGRTLGVGGRRGRYGSLLVAAEIGLAVTLIIAAGLVVQSMLRLQGVDVGFDATNAQTARIALPEYRFGEPHRRTAFFSSVLDDLRARPEVVAATAVDALPFHSISSTTFAVEGRPFSEDDGTPFIGLLVVTPGYWSTMGIPLGAGREFRSGDDADALPIAVINETMARRFWPGEDPVGNRMTFDPPDDPDAVWRTVVGVAEDNLSWRRNGARPEAFVPYAQMPVPEMFLVFRTGVADPGAAAAAVRASVWRVDPDQPVFDFRAMETYLEREITPWRDYAAVLTFFSALALLLALLGVYGVMSYMVRRRTPELGLRMALGAQAGSVLWLVLRRAGALVLLGSGIGILGALGATRLLSGLLFGIAPLDVATFAGVIGLLGGAALLAAYLPARRASRIDPALTLRGE